MSNGQDGSEGRSGLRGQVAVVTGGSRGLGFLLARELLWRGCQVALLARDGGELERASLQLGAPVAEVTGVPCDVGDEDQVAAAVAQVERRLGPVDVLVNNAGMIRVGPLAALGPADVKRAVEVMLLGVVNPTMAVLPGMLRRGRGRVVTITSIGGKLAAPHLLPYTTAKFGAVGFSEALRVELAGTGVRVTTVVPGLMRTGSHLNAEFIGQPAREFAWFGLAASLPLVSMDAERAARRIVNAAERGRAELMLTPLAHVAARAWALAPGLCADVAGLIARVLPDPGQAPARPAEPGFQAARRQPASAASRLMGLGTAAARRFNQFGPANRA